MVKSFCNIILLLACVVCIKGQTNTAVAEYKKLVSSQSKAEYLSINIEVNAYETKADKKADLMGKGLLRRNKSYSYSKYNEQESVFAERYTIVVNNESKTIDYYEHEKNKRPKMKNDMFPLIDSVLIGMGESFQYHGVKDNQKHFSISTPEDMIERTDMYFNVSDNLLSKIVYSYGPSTDDYEAGIAVAVISYKNYSFAKVDIKGGKENYIVKEGGVWRGAGAYKGYKVNYIKG